MSSSFLGISFAVDLSVNLYQARASALGISVAADLSLWYGWAALALIVIGGILGILDSVKFGKRKLIAIGGVLVLLSAVIFAAGLQMELSKAPPAEDFPMVNLFSSGSYDSESAGVSMNYSSYLSFGFWLAIVAAFIMLFVSMKKPMEELAAPPPPPLPPPPPPTP